MSESTIFESWNHAVKGIIIPLVYGYPIRSLADTEVKLKIIFKNIKKSEMNTSLDSIAAYTWDIPTCI